jgi:Putative beta-barrel porin-2, OmpL-like. bbp2
MRPRAGVLAAALVCAPVVGAAQTPAPPPAWTDRVTFDGLVDFFYAYQLGGGGVQRLVPAYHVFSDEGNSLTLAYAKLGVGVKAEPVGLRLDLGYGHVADVIASDKAAGPGSDAAAIRFVEQAYMTFALPVRIPLTLDVGKFVSTAGAEAIEASRNWSYSHTFMFGYATPYTLTGLRLSVTPTPRLTV